MGKSMWKIEEKERMTTPITLPPLDTATLAELRRRYENTPNVESRMHSQMLLLAQQDDKVIRPMDGNRRERNNHVPRLLRRGSTCFAAFLHICECFWLSITILPFMSATSVLGQVCCQSHG